MQSSLEIYDLESERTTILLQTDAHIEAPNWAPSGDWLLVNADGRLYRVDLARPAMDPFDTGDFTQCNNDHGFSPDGALIALSDKHLTEQSCIFVMPTAGGTPQRVTSATPSWYHGWSPDGARLIYTCVRDGIFGIATCAPDGGDETVLISGPGHYDGPDYTPDGAWVWFNSDRGGVMDLWRMRADGSDPQRMTDGEEVDWFPHPSPDGRHVLYLAYPPGTEGHPFGRNVTLRLMPIDGGEARPLLALFGGQGTLNVPCWSPDGSRFAFVRYFDTD
ncbi:MAG: hypothetical protein AAGF79_12500 [Pseudomonadota bacterium]